MTHSAHPPHSGTHDPGHTAIADWIGSNAHPLTSLDPDAALDDMQPLRAMVGDAVVVGLSRPTHGAHELSILTHRVLRYLVEELGFRSLAIEDDWSTGLEIDTHLRTGEGDLPLLLDTAFPQWQNEEFLEVLRWMRSYNEQHPNDHLRFVGVDVSAVRGVVYDAVVDHVRRVAPDQLNKLNALYDTLRLTAAHQRVRPDEQQRIDTARLACDLLDALSDDEGHAIARQHAQVILAYHEYLAIDPSISMAYLEARLAENLAWWHEHTGHRTLYWSGSHSAVGDVRLVDFGGHGGAQPSRNAGSYLREHFGRGYLSGGLTLHHGSVSLGPARQEIPDPQPDRPDALLGSVGLDRYLLDLHADESPMVRSWLDSPAKLRLIGPGYEPANDGDYHMSNGSLADWFDLIIHCQRVTATQPC